MKKILVALLVLAAILCLGACGDENVSVPYRYGDAFSSGQDGNCATFYTYPAFEGKKELNDEIREYSCSYMLEYLNLNMPSDKEAVYSIDNVTATYKGQDFASFLCIGSFCIDGADEEYPIAYTLNIDLKNEKILEFDDIVASYDVLEDLFENNMKYIKTGNSDTDKKVNELSKDDFLAEYGMASSVYPYVYFIGEGNSVKFAVSVKTAYELGGHAEFEIKLSKTKSLFTDEMTALLPTR